MLGESIAQKNLSFVGDPQPGVAVLLCLTFQSILEL